MEKRVALAFALSMGILIGFQYLFPPPERTSAPEVAPSQESAPAASIDASQPIVSVPVAEPGPAPLEPGPTIVVETDLFRAEFASRGGRIVRFELLRYPAEPGRGQGFHDLIVADGPGPLALLWRSDSGAVVDDRSVLYEVEATERSVGPGGGSVVTMRGATSSGGSIVKTLEIAAGSYLLEYSVTTKGLGATPLAVSWSRKVDEHSSSGDIVGPVAYLDSALQHYTASAITEPEVLEGQTAWAGYAEHYFLAAYAPQARQPLKTVVSVSEGAGHTALWTTQPADSLRYSLYLGPKSIEVLESAGHELVTAVDLGWFWFVARPLLWALLHIERVVGNYGWAIIILTIVVRILLYPVNEKQISAMKGMQRIQPEIKKIQDRYQDDREKMNLEMMELYRRHGVNPLAGCLPMFVQLPFFIGLYNVLLQAIELRQAPFVGWITDLSQPDRLGAFALPFVSPPGIPVMTVLMGASMLVQQRMTPSTADPTQQRIMLVMPVVFTVMFVNFPSGLVLYWLSNNVLSIGQQWLSNRSEK